MFTGIIEAVGTLAALEPRGSQVGVVVDAPAVIAGVRIGDSIAVNGACLTVTKIDAGRLHFDAVRETLERTSLGDLRVGARVNLERAMRADGRLDGHIVQGHVDGTGRVADARATATTCVSAVRVRARDRALPRAEGLGRDRRRVADGRGRRPTPVSTSR